MKDNIAEVGSRHVGEIKNINRELTEKALHMRCLSYLSQVKAILLTETIFEIDNSKKVLLDNNKQLMLQKELIEQQNRLLSEKNMQLKAFSHSVSHDLGAPLRRIQGFAQILLDDYRDKLDTQAVSYLTRITSAAENMAQLIDSMLRLGRVSYHQLALEQVDLSALALKIVNQLRQDEPARDVKVTIQPDMIVKGDRSMLEMALQNLLANAWKFTSKATMPAIEFGVADVDDERTFFVKDNGAGFNPRCADKLFKEFSRLHRQEEFSGTGIGLAIAQRIISRHGGTIWAESSENHGATFYFRLHKDIDTLLKLSTDPAGQTNT